MRWYSVVNYLISVIEQVLLWIYCDHIWFWICLVLNIMGIIVIGDKISMLEKKLSLTK